MTPSSVSMVAPNCRQIVSFHAASMSGSGSPALCRVHALLPRNLQEAAEGVRQLHLLRGLAVGLEQGGAADHDARTHRARGGDVEAVGIEEEVHATRRVLGR